MEKERTLEQRLDATICRQTAEIVRLQDTLRQFGSVDPTDADAIRFLQVACRPLVA